jgi:hypothetical protein
VGRGCNEDVEVTCWLHQKMFPNGDHIFLENPEHAVLTTYNHKKFVWIENINLKLSRQMSIWVALSHTTY